MKLSAPLALLAAPLLPVALGWGAAGHEIVATIAQIHLYPEVRAALKQILPSEAKGHLAAVAAWADSAKGQAKYRYTASMHYVNGKGDDPATKCVFGEQGWVDEDRNVLTAISNLTSEIMRMDNPIDQDVPVRFLTHYVGDMHQPLHLCGKLKGGNMAHVLLEGHDRNLHSVWDSGLLNIVLREFDNYTSPLPSRDIESALYPGARFNPYVRWIVWEGIRQWWSSDLSSWTSCPAGGDPYPHSSNSPIPASHPLRSQFTAFASSALGLLPLGWSHWVTKHVPIAVRQVEGFTDQLLSSTPEQLSLASEAVTSLDGDRQLAFDFPACPYSWAKELHSLNCELVWPKDYCQGCRKIELDTPAYFGEMKNRKTLEKLFAMAGLRLAKILNEAIGGKDFAGVFMGYSQ